MSDLGELFNELLLNHAKYPSGRGELIGYQIKATRENALCGDRITVMALEDKNGLLRMTYRDRGCFVLTASASLMFSRCEGKRPLEVLKVIKALNTCLVERLSPDPCLKEVKALEVVASFPSRANCALLPWQALTECLNTSLSTSQSNHKG